MAHEEEKKAAGRAAAKLVRDGEIVGLGTGSTAYFAVVALGERVKAGLKITGIPTSVHTADLARALGIPLTPLDDIAFARTVIEKKIISLGATPKLRIKPDGSTFITDNGNQILDCSFGQIKDPAALARVLSDTPGIVEHGLFIGIAKQAFVGKGTSG